MSLETHLDVKSFFKITPQPQNPAYGPGNESPGKRPSLQTRT